MSALLRCLAAAALALPAAGRDAFDSAWRLVGEGRYAEALELAREASGTLAGARARLLVLHHAGDLRGALRAGLQGLDDHPADAWLLDQTAYVALSLRDAGRGDDLARRLALAAESDALPPEEAARYRDRAASHAQEAAAVIASDRARSRALGLSRATVAAAGIAALAFLGWLAFAPSRVARKSGAKN